MSSDSSSDSDVDLEVVEIVEPESKSSSSRKKISDVYDYIKEDSHTSAKFYCGLCKEKNKIQRWRVRVNTAIFPRVALMARDFLGVTSTSVPSECVFSNSGTVVSKRRARLGDDAIQAICELQSFLQFK